MSPIVIKPDLAIDLATAGAVVARTGVDGQIAAISLLYGGEISAVYELALAGGLPPLVLKIYPDSMSWKMRKEARMLDLVRDRLPVPAPRLHLADASSHVYAFEESDARTDNGGAGKFQLGVRWRRHRGTHHRRGRGCLATASRRRLLVLPSQQGLRDQAE